VVDAIRNTYKFRGYIHLKVMPGAGPEYVEAAHRLGTRLSVNIETPSAEALHRISPHKDFNGGTLWLLPGEWYASLPAGYEFTSINGIVEVFKRGESDDDIRMGVLPYGILVPKGAN